MIQPFIGDHDRWFSTGLKITFFCSIYKSHLKLYITFFFKNCVSLCFKSYTAFALRNCFIERNCFFFISRLIVLELDVFRFVPDNAVHEECHEHDERRHSVENFTEFCWIVEPASTKFSAVVFPKEAGGIHHSTVDDGARYVSCKTKKLMLKKISKCNISKSNKS